MEPQEIDNDYRKTDHTEEYATTGLGRDVICDRDEYRPEIEELPEYFRFY